MSLITFQTTIQTASVDSPCPILTCTHTNHLCKAIMIQSLCHSMSISTHAEHHPMTDLAPPKRIRSRWQKLRQSFSRVSEQGLRFIRQPYRVCVYHQTRPHRLRRGLSKHKDRICTHVKAAMESEAALTSTSIFNRTLKGKRSLPKNCMSG